MAEKEKDQPQQPTHRAYSVIRREGQDDFWLNLGLAFPHKDGKGFNIMLQAFPLDGKIVCREASGDEEAEAASRPERNDRQKRRGCWRGLHRARARRVAERRKRGGATPGFPV